jgi:hypothetical protein
LLALVIPPVPSQSPDDLRSFGQNWFQSHYLNSQPRLMFSVWRVLKITISITGVAPCHP